jgi:TP901 family phage tail tape measure protein
MSNVMNLAIQITAIDMLSSVVERVKGRVLSLGSSAGKVKQDFEEMTTGITRGLKAIAVGAYALQKTLPGIQTAANMQEAMLKVKSNLVSSAKDAADLDRSMKSVKSSAIAISANAPFSAEQVVNIEAALLKAGVAMGNVVGQKGAAWAATALATVSGEAPEMIGDSLARIGDMFKFKGDQYGQFADWIARVDDASSSSVPELVYGLRLAGSSAAALKISANDTVTALGALAPLGDRAGSSLSNFYIAVAAKRKELIAGNIRLFENGQFVGMGRAIDILKEKFGAIKDDQRRLGQLIKIFGEEGGRAANQFINSEKGFRGLNAEAQKAADLGKKLSIWGEGFNAAMKKLGGTAKTTLASLFDPLLAPLRSVLDLLNTVTSKVGEFAEKHKALSGMASGGALAVAGGAGLYGLYSLAKGGMAGARVLKGIGGIKGLLKGFGGTAAGIAEGKAIEAATGVTPVFVTNWPGNMSGGGAVQTAADLAGKGGWLAKIAKSAPMLLGGKLALAGGAGYAAGTGINMMLGGISNWATDGKYGGSGWLGDMVFDWLHGEGVKNTINITVDKDGRVIANSDNMSTTVNAKRGKF